jgi:hypothetical protein
MEWLALQDPPHTPQASGDDPVFLHSQNEVLAARGIKAALTAENRTQEFLISANQADDAARRQTADLPRPHVAEGRVPFARALMPDQVRLAQAFTLNYRVRHPPD